MNTTLVRLPAGATVPLQKNWFLRVLTPHSTQALGDREDVNGDYIIFNTGGADPLADTPRQLFFTGIAGQYSPMIDEERELAAPIGQADYRSLNGQPATPTDKVKGVMLLGAGGFEERLNLTNFRDKAKGRWIDGPMLIEAKGKEWVLVGLVAENRARIKGYIGVYRPRNGPDDNVGTVQVLEIQDLIFQWAKSFFGEVVAA